MSRIIKRPGTRHLMAQLAKESEGLSINERRDFLRKGVMTVGGLAATFSATQAIADTSNLPPMEPKWSKMLGHGVVEFPYGQPSQYESHVVRRTVPWLTAESISSISMSPLQDLKGIITPNGLVFERYHAGVPQINPEEHRLIIHGLVNRPIIFTMADLMRFPSVSEIKFIECPANGGMEWKGAQMEALQFTHGMLSCCEWTGVPLRTLLEEVGVQPEGKWILAEGADGAHMSRSIPLEKALDDTLVVYAQNGEMLRPEQGYPLRLINPGWEGNTSVKWLRRLEIGDKPWYHREETSKYTDLMPDGRARKFSFVQETNSVITNPCPENPIKQSGLIEIEGVAWSGRGKIKQVDVSFDGGVSWTPAKLKGLVLAKALTRFSLVTKWDGQPWLLQARAIDETGYVQPTLKQLRKIRGGNSIYHKNSIHTWQVAANGEVTNVQIS
ncbi:sulfite dehydrogenase [Neptunomonas qingdaonensis]|uniref:Sulfane dehydrogenase subunit SoxC n=1 Tax=Neptunomonas qingdaonensis TaxID=1045558 RepID=A0A1I2W1Q8_9GAMM|nr:sulfite dehydrogenase [Neptunomonas qingdaonensis]SFG95334.1 sulfane dehydrogenase subunit SoxC [Neptunomonas qingdaonensis]